METSPKQKKLLYEGSVKDVFQIEDQELLFHFSNRYSVFDWGAMPDEIPGKGEALAELAELFFKLAANPDKYKNIKLEKSLDWCADELKTLQQKGMRSHFIKRVGPEEITVEKVAVFRPKTHSLGTQLFHEYPKYSSLPESRLIPLEVVFRWGAPAGSSFLKREPTVQEGQRFSSPVVEFFSKLEETDRFLNHDEALALSGLTFSQFKSMYARTVLLAFVLKDFFHSVGLELWDGKFEWALHKDGEIILVDSIGPDELRLIEPGTKIQMSKEYLRQFYRKSSWYVLLEQEKRQNPKDFIQGVLLKQPEGPPVLPLELLDLVKEMYGTLKNLQNISNAKSTWKDLGERMKKWL